MPLIDSHLFSAAIISLSRKRCCVGLVNQHLHVANITRLVGFHMKLHHVSKVYRWVQRHLGQINANIRSAYKLLVCSCLLISTFIVWIHILLSVLSRSEGISSYTLSVLLLCHHGFGRNYIARSFALLLSYSQIGRVVHSNGLDNPSLFDLLNFAWRIKCRYL